MAAVVETHVQSSDTELHDDDEFEEGSDGGSDVDGSENGAREAGSDAEGSDAEAFAESDGDNAEDEADGEDNANTGWAEAMAKILGKKTPQNQSTILQKNRELVKEKEKEREEQLERRKQLDKRRSWEMLSRVKPDLVQDREAEKALQRVATRGVVQLFNAVRKHQKTIDEKVKEVGGSERKKAKILSSVSKDFIDVLRRTDESSGKTIKKEKKATVTVKEEQEEPAWSVLRDDFMMGASMKDWDKDSDREEPRDEPQSGQDSD